MLRVGVLGAAGRMGSEVCRAVVGDPGLELAAAVDPRAASGGGVGAEPAVAAVAVSADIETLRDAAVDVAVDFTIAAECIENLRWCAANRVHAVSGTTGLSQDEVRALEPLFSSSEANCVIAPNFAIGAVLMMRFAELAAAQMEGVEIVELHHDAKRDSPSGTAIETARRIAEVRSRSGSSPTGDDPLSVSVIEGARGAVGPGSVPIHSVRLRGLLAHQEVLFGSQGQTLAIRHDTYDRGAFMPGVLRAVKAVPDLPGLTLGLDRVLGL